MDQFVARSSFPVIAPERLIAHGSELCGGFAGAVATPGLVSALDESEQRPTRDAGLNRGCSFVEELASRMALSTRSLRTISERVD
jgi:hypothetical protein